MIRRTHLLMMLVGWILWEQATSQNVGVGTTTPQARLHIQIPPGYGSPAFLIHQQGQPVPYLVVTSDGRVGIGVSIPQRVLHVADTVRIDALAGSPQGGVVIVSSAGDLLRMDFPGDSSRYLAGDGTWRPIPAGGGGGGGGGGGTTTSPVRVFTATASSNVLVSSTTWTQIPGLSVSITPTDTFLAIILTRGLLQDDISGNLDDLSPVEVAVFQNGTLMQDGVDVLDMGASVIFDPLFGPVGIWTRRQNKWVIHAFTTVYPGSTVTFDVRARMYVTSFGGSTFDPFYAGGRGVNTPNIPEAVAEGTLIVLLIPQ